MFALRTLLSALAVAILVRSQATNGVDGPVPAPDGDTALDPSIVTAMDSDQSNGYRNWMLRRAPAASALVIPVHPELARQQPGQRPEVVPQPRPAVAQHQREPGAGRGHPEQGTVRCRDQPYGHGRLPGQLAGGAQRTAQLYGLAFQDSCQSNYGCSSFWYATLSSIVIPKSLIRGVQRLTIPIPLTLPRLAPARHTTSLQEVRRPFVRPRGRLFKVHGTALRRILAASDGGTTKENQTRWTPMTPRNERAQEG